MHELEYYELKKKNVIRKNFFFYLTAARISRSQLRWWFLLYNIARVGCLGLSCGEETLFWNPLVQSSLLFAGRAVSNVHQYWLYYDDPSMDCHFTDIATYKVIEKMLWCIVYFSLGVSIIMFPDQPACISLLKLSEEFFLMRYHWSEWSSPEHTPAYFALLMFVLWALFRQS